MWKPQTQPQDRPQRAPSNREDVDPVTDVDPFDKNPPWDDQAREVDPPRKAPTAHEAGQRFVWSGRAWMKAPQPRGARYCFDEDAGV